MKYNRSKSYIMWALGRALASVMGGGLPGIFKKLADSFEMQNAFVVRLTTHSTGRLSAISDGVSIEEIQRDDVDSLEELTRIDEWKIPFAVTLQHLGEGQICYVAKLEGKIAAVQWVIIEQVFEEYLLRRMLTLSSNEAYGWRSYTIPAYRGKGLQPVMNRYIVADLAERYGKEYYVGLVATHNRTQLRALSKVSEPPVGRIGYIEIPGFRFHYLWGTDALPSTKERFSLQRVL